MNRRSFFAALSGASFFTAALAKLGFARKTRVLDSSYSPLIGLINKSKQDGEDRQRCE